MILSNAVARHNEPYDRLAEESVKRRLLIVGIVSGGTAEGHARTTCLVIGRSAHVEQGLQDGSCAPQIALQLAAVQARLKVNYHSECWRGGRARIPRAGEKQNARATDDPATGH